MLISFTVSPEHAEELMTVLSPLIVKGKKRRAANSLEGRGRVSYR